MLCLRPESWAEAARYPSHVTLVALALVVVLAAALIAGSDAVRLSGALQDFAQGYDSHPYPALELHSDGTLSADGPLPEPIRIQLPTPGAVILVDPTGKTVPETIKTPGVLFLTDKEILAMSDQGPAFRYSLAGILGGPLSPVALPPAGQTRRIDGAAMQGFLHSHQAIFVGGAIMAGVFTFFAEALWAAVMMFLLCPIVMLATAGPRLNPEVPDRRLILPKRAAYRMAAAVLVPLIALGAVLHASGHPVAALLGGEGSILFWFFSAGALAIWTGFMARRMYGNRDRRGR
jgi:hypothetical protein